MTPIDQWHIAYHHLIGQFSLNFWETSLDWLMKQFLRNQLICCNKRLIKDKTVNGPFLEYKPSFRPSFQPFSLFLGEWIFLSFWTVMIRVDWPHARTQNLSVARKLRFCFSVNFYGIWDNKNWDFVKLDKDLILKTPWLNWNWMLLKCIIKSNWYII